MIVMIVSIFRSRSISRNRNRRGSSRRSCGKFCRK